MAWRRASPWAAGVAVLFAVGLVVGQTGTPDGPRSAPSRWTHTMRSVGLAGAWSDVEVTSNPEGAWIAVDGTPLALRTPATIEVEPGVHQITLSLDGMGETMFQVDAPHRRTVSLNGDLRGTVRVASVDPDVPIAIRVDGEKRGYAPVEIAGLTPGPHLIEFAGPGMPPWTQTVEVRVGAEVDLVARPFDAPDTGVLEVRALAAGATGPEPVRGATVWVDGSVRGTTPLVLELERGPHSVRVERGDSRPPVQVIDLPGGNERFATFQMGDDGDQPILRFAETPRAFNSNPSPSLKVMFDEIAPRDVGSLWLHVRSPAGVWRRYAMQAQPAPGGVTATIAFPTDMAGGDGRAVYYASASTRAGDEFFTEIEGIPPPRERAKRSAAAPSTSSTPVSPPAKRATAPATKVSQATTPAPESAPARSAPAPGTPASEQTQGTGSPPAASSSPATGAPPAGTPPAAGAPPATSSSPPPATP